MALMSPEIDISGGIVFYKNRNFVLLHRFGVSQGSRETLKAEFGWGVAAASAATGEEQEAGEMEPQQSLTLPVDTGAFQKAHARCPSSWSSLARTCHCPLRPGAS